MTPARLRRYWSKWKVRWPRSRPTAPTTKAALTTASPSATLMQPWSCRRAPQPCPATWPRLTRRSDRHLQCIAEHGCMGWQKASGYNTRARAEAAIARWKQVIGDGLRSRKDERRATEVAVAVHALNHMLAFGRPISVHIA